MRIVFDTNVLFSAFMTHGLCAGLYEGCLHHAQVIISPDILRELEASLRTKARLTAAEAREIVQAVRADSELVNPARMPTRVCRDRNDDGILATALAATADALVTADQDLLVLKSFREIKIVSPRNCLALVTSH